jgi:hypothetical protein
MSSTTNQERNQAMHEPDATRPHGEQEREYTALWQIELTAASPRAAAEQALEVQRDPRSDALVFDITADGAPPVRVDLADTDAEPDRQPTPDCQPSPASMGCRHEIVRFLAGLYGADRGFRLDRGAFASHLNVDGDDTRYGLYAFGKTIGQKVARATTRALTCRAITSPDGALLYVIAADSTAVAITVRDQPPTATQLHARASARLPCYRLIGDTRGWSELQPTNSPDTFTGTCETIELVLQAANGLLPALAALQLGEAHAMSLLAEPLRVLTYSHRGRLSTDTIGMSDLTEDDPEQTKDLWPPLIQALETGEAAEDWDGDRQHTLLLRTGGATTLAREMNAARARLLYTGASHPGELPDPSGGFSRYLA